MFKLYMKNHNVQVVVCSINTISIYTISDNGYVRC